MSAKNIIKRKGYKLHFVDPADEEKLNELRNTGRVVGEITISTASMGDAMDEVILAVRE